MNAKSGGSVLLLGPLMMAGGCSITPGPSLPGINTALVQVSPVQDGKVVVSGGAGTTSGETYRVTVTVHRAGDGAASQEPDGHIIVLSETIRTAPDGSFPAITIGTEDRPLQVGDELNLRPSRVFLGRPTVPYELRGKNEVVALR